MHAPEEDGDDAILDSEHGTRPGPASAGSLGREHSAQAMRIWKIHAFDCKPKNAYAACTLEPIFDLSKCDISRAVQPRLMTRLFPATVPHTKECRAKGKTNHIAYFKVKQRGTRARSWRYDGLG
jgi:hypothetical protein